MGGQIYLGRRLGNVFVWETLPNIHWTEWAITQSICTFIQVVPISVLSSGRIDPSFHSQCIWLIPSLRLKHDRYILEPLELDGLSWQAQAQISFQLKALRLQNHVRKRQIMVWKVVELHNVSPFFWDKSPETFLLCQHRYLSPSLLLLLINQA